MAVASCCKCRAMELPLRDFAGLSSHEQRDRGVEQTVRRIVCKGALRDGQIHLPHADRRRPHKAGIAKVSGLVSMVAYSSDLPDCMFLGSNCIRMSRFAVAGGRNRLLRTMRFVSWWNGTMSTVTVGVCSSSCARCNITWAVLGSRTRCQQTTTQILPATQHRLLRLHCQTSMLHRSRCLSAKVGKDCFI